MGDYMIQLHTDPDSLDDYERERARDGSGLNALSL
jgi:hypothetical protein